MIEILRFLNHALQAFDFGLSDFKFSENDKLVFEVASRFDSAKPRIEIEGGPERASANLDGFTKEKGNSLGWISILIND